MSLETPVGDEGDSSYGDFIPDENIVSPGEETNKVLLSEGLDKAFKKLDEREATVLRLRHGLLDGREHTLEEVGTHFGVTRERIRQIEGKALLRQFQPVARSPQRLEGGHCLKLHREVLN
jgi:RNA polymerase primary sigma factor